MAPGIEKASVWAGTRGQTTKYKVIGNEASLVPAAPGAARFSREIGVGMFPWVRQAFVLSGGLGSNSPGLKWWLKVVIPPLSLSLG